eukprot:gb/GEZN01011194.1/.p2 GENE.gb/GEZN01011194.1/~~gb/GEZN01011194.1/.p2  ORF type:complete len:212 (+),score=11.84 gb/GEZN01011194.1/:401-1036(+)
MSLSAVSFGFLVSPNKSVRLFCRVVVDDDSKSQSFFLVIKAICGNWNTRFIGAAVLRPDENQRLAFSMCPSLGDCFDANVGDALTVREALDGRGGTLDVDSGDELAVLEAIDGGRIGALKDLQALVGRGGIAMECPRDDLVEACGNTIECCFECSFRNGEALRGGESMLKDLEALVGGGNTRGSRCDDEDSVSRLLWTTVRNSFWIDPILN